MVFCELAFVDGVLHDAERKIIEDAEKILNCPGFLDSFMTEAVGLCNEKELHDLYALLECPPGVSNDELKRAYRQKCNVYHPDKLNSKELPPEFTLFAVDQMQKINNAYEVICRVRKINGIQ
jgi:DnaJ like chaperone protein